MAFRLADLVKDTSTTTGTGSVTVSGTAPTGFQTFDDVMESADTTFYAIRHQTLGEWEVGVGTYSGSNVLARTTVLASSNSGSKVNFSAGTKDVFMDAPASKIVLYDQSGNISPSENDSGALGTTSLGWSDAFFASGAVFNWDNGDVTLTHTNNTLSVTGDSGFISFSITGNTSSNNFIPKSGGSFLANTVAGGTANIGAWDVDGAAIKSFITLTSNDTPTATMSDVTASSDFVPTTDDGAALGDATHGWSNFFMASGAALNIANSNWVATHTSGVLTVGTGDLRVTTAGTDDASVVTAGGAQTLTNKTLTDPIVGTQANSDSSTKAASTAFVKNVAEPLGSETINTQTATYTLVLTDAGKLIRMNVATANDLTIPTNSSVAFAAGARIDVAQSGAGTTTIKGDTGVTVNGVSAGSGEISQQYGAVCLIKTDTDTWEVYGAIGDVS